MEGREGAVRPGDESGRDRPDKKEYDGSSSVPAEASGWGGMVSPKAQEGKLNPRTERFFSKSLRGSRWESRYSPPPLISCSGSPYAELYLVVTKG